VKSLVDCHHGLSRVLMSLLQMPIARPSSLDPQPRSVTIVRVFHHDEVVR
jgi:hypothetical protein